MKKTLLQRLGLLGVVSFLSYTAAVVFAPLAYPGYNWMAQAVSDLSAANAPSLALWNQLSALYNVCEVVCVTVVCIGIQGQKTKLLRSGIYLFAVMEWTSHRWQSSSSQEPRAKADVPTVCAPLSHWP